MLKKRWNNGLSWCGKSSALAPLDNAHIMDKKCMAHFRVCCFDGIGLAQGMAKRSEDLLRLKVLLYDAPHRLQHMEVLLLSASIFLGASHDVLTRAH